MSGRLHTWPPRSDVTDCFAIDRRLALKVVLVSVVFSSFRPNLTWKQSMSCQTLQQQSNARWMPDVCIHHLHPSPRMCTRGALLFFWGGVTADGRQDSQVNGHGPRIRRGSRARRMRCAAFGKFEIPQLADGRLRSPSTRGPSRSCSFTSCKDGRTHLFLGKVLVVGRLALPLASFFLDTLEIRHPLPPSMHGAALTLELLTPALEAREVKTLKSDAVFSVRNFRFQERRNPGIYFSMTQPRS
jgi:hypothetical protein